MWRTNLIQYSTSSSKSVKASSQLTNSSCVGKRFRGTLTGAVLDRIDHLSIYADDRKPLWEFFQNGLGLQTCIPPTTYAFGEEDASFELEMLHLGSGVGIEIYSDPSLVEWRRKLRRPNCTIVNVALAPAGNDYDRATSLMLRRGAHFHTHPFVYHFTDDQIAASNVQVANNQLSNPLPRWLFKKLPIQIGDAAFIHDQGAAWASRMQDLPQLAYFFLCMWHKDFAHRPYLWRQQNMITPMGPYGIVGCNRIFWSIPHDEDEVGKIAVQFSRMNHAVSQFSTHEAAIMFPEGPQLHVVAESSPEREGYMGRVSGIELAVQNWDQVVADIHKHPQYKGRIVSSGNGFAESESTQLGSDTTSLLTHPNSSSSYHPLDTPWMKLPGEDTGALPVQTQRMIIDTECIGAPGIEIHLVPSTPLQDRLAEAAEIQQELLLESQQRSMQFAISQQGQERLRSSDPRNTFSASSISNESSETSSASNESNNSLETSSASNDPFECAVRSHELSVQTQKASSLAVQQQLHTSIPPALTMSNRIATTGREFTQTNGRLIRSNDRRPREVAYQTVEELEETRASKPMSKLRELFWFGRL